MSHRPLPVSPAAAASTSAAEALFSSVAAPFDAAMRTPLRPLGALSDFVAAALPPLLRGMREGTVQLDVFAERLACAIAAMPPAQPYDEASTALACLDLSLLQHACDHIGSALPDTARERLHALCTAAGRPPAFVYEDCVLNNPLDADPRLFCDGAVGASERDFLRSHQWVEAELVRALACTDALAACADAPPGVRVMRLREALSAQEAPLREALMRMEAAFSALRAMPLADFRTFRGYYAPSPRTGTPGPSGRFSARFFLLRFALEGASLLRRQPDIATEIVELNPLYPRGDRDRLLAWAMACRAPMPASGDGKASNAPHAVSRSGLAGLAGLALQPWAQSTSLPALVRCARDTLDRCTAMHLGLARKYAANPSDIGHERRA